MCIKYLESKNSLKYIRRAKQISVQTLSCYIETILLEGKICIKIRSSMAGLKLEPNLMASTNPSRVTTLMLLSRSCFLCCASEDAQSHTASRNYCQQKHHYALSDTYFLEHRCFLDLYQPKRGFIITKIRDYFYVGTTYRVSQSLTAKLSQRTINIYMYI